MYSQDLSGRPMHAPSLLQSNLSERQVEADVASYLGHISSYFGEFRLLDVNEQRTGADRTLNWSGVAYFFQFKKPWGLPELTTTPKVRSNEGLFQRARRYRFELGLDQTPHSICFALREKAKNATEYQHNVLLGFEKPPYSRAVYVCPTELNSDRYMRALNPGPGYLGVPAPFIESAGQWVIHEGYLARVCELSLFLRAHAAITPHSTVSTAEHCYTFSIHATHVVFHSPDLVTAGPSRLSDFVSGEVRRLFANPEIMLPLPRLARQLYEQSPLRDGRGGLQPPNGREGEALDWLQYHGRVLDKEHGIRQILAMRARR